jgi:hypothetical protein
MGLFAFWPKRQFLVFLLAVPFAGCGGKAASSSPEPSLPQVGIQLNQTSVRIPAGGQQQFTAAVHGTSNTSDFTCWNGFLYSHCEDDVLRVFSWSNGQLSPQSVAEGTPILTAHGATISLSANGTTNGMVWEIDNSNHSSGGPAILRAYDAMNVATELSDSMLVGSRDTAGLALKFTVPTIADGKVFAGTSNELDIYGLLGH